MKKISKILCKFLACSFALTSNLQVSNIKVSAIFNINERLKEIQDKEYKEVDDALDEIDINHFKQKKLSTIHCEYIKDIRSYIWILRILYLSLCIYFTNECYSSYNGIL